MNAEIGLLLLRFEAGELFLSETVLHSRRMRRQIVKGFVLVCARKIRSKASA